MTWTYEQLEKEWRYYKEERLALLCEDREPTQRELDIAITESDRHVKELQNDRTEARR